jgi:hypothetical protein
MKSWKRLGKIGLITGILLVLMVSACGCTENNQLIPSPAVSTQNATTPIVTEGPTTTSTPQSNPASIESYMTSQGYNISESFSYNKTNSRGQAQYDGVVVKDGIVYVVEVTVCGSASAANDDLSVGVTAAANVGYTGNYQTATHWAGQKTSDTGDVYYMDLFTTASNWSVTMLHTSQ